MRPEKVGSLDVHPVASIFPLLEGEEFAALVADIKANGLREPILRMWIRDEYNPRTKRPLILDGRNRLLACDKARRPPEFADYDGPTDTASLLALVRSKNLARRHLDESQRAWCAAKADELYEAAAKERQAEAARATTAKRKGAPAPAEDAQRKSALSGKASELAAADFGVSSRLVEYAKHVEEKGSRELQRAVERGEIKVSAAAELADLPKAEQLEVLERAKGKPGSIRALKRQHERQKQAAEIAARPAPLTLAGPFDVLVADPCWAYDARAEDATHRGLTPYATMPTDEICALAVAGKPVSELVNPNAALFLWTTNAHMRDAYDVVAAWEFTPKTILTWCKDRMGLGNYLRNQTEHCLVCVRGKPVFNLTNQTTILHGPVREHSRKPDSFYELVEGLCPGSKLELFAREPRKGWAVWGAEATKFAEAG